MMKHHPTQGLWPSLRRLWQVNRLDELDARMLRDIGLAGRRRRADLGPEAWKIGLGLR